MHKFIFLVAVTLFQLSIHDAGVRGQSDWNDWSLGNSATEGGYIYGSSCQQARPRVSIGESCDIKCMVKDMDEDNQYIAVTKTVTYHHYEYNRTYGPYEFYSTVNGFEAEVTNTSRYTADIQNKTDTNAITTVTITFRDTVPGDSGHFYCELRSKNHNIVLNKTDIIPVSISGATVTLRFATREPGTEGKQIRLEEIFDNREEVEFDDEEFDRLVYIINATDVITDSPTVSFFDKLTDQQFQFKSRYHNVSDNTQALIPRGPLDVTYLYHPTGVCYERMTLLSTYTAGGPESILTRELMIDGECSSAIQASTSIATIVASLAFCVITFLRL